MSEILGNKKINSQFLGQHPIVRTYKGTILINDYRSSSIPPLVHYYAYTNDNEQSVYTSDDPIKAREFELENATAVGSLNNNEGVYSGFSNSNYILVSDTLPTITTSGKMIFKLSYLSNVAQYIINATNENKCLVEWEGYLRYWDGSNGISGNTMLSVGNTYWVGLELFPNQVKGYLLQDNDNTYTKDTLPAFTSTWNLEFTFNSNIFQNINVFIGRSYDNTDSTAWQGTIDLTNTYFDYDNVETTFGSFSNPSTLYNSALTPLNPQPTFTVEKTGLINAINHGCTDLGSGVYQGGSDKCLIMNSTPSLATANSWEFKTKVTYNGGGANPCIFGCSGSDNRTPIFGHVVYDTMWALLSSTGYDWGLYYGEIKDVTTQEVLTLTSNTTYYFKFGFTGTSYYLWYSTVGWSDTGKTLTYLESSTKVFCDDPLMLLNNNFSRSNYYWAGNIDMTQTSITIDGVTTPLYRAKPTVVINNVDYVRTPANDLLG